MISILEEILGFISKIVEKIVDVANRTYNLEQENKAIKERLDRVELSLNNKEDKEPPWGGPTYRG